jgi:hypothetical protein
MQTMRDFPCECVIGQIQHNRETVAQLQCRGYRTAQARVGKLEDRESVVPIGQNGRVE